MTTTVAVTNGVGVQTGKLFAFDAVSTVNLTGLASAYNGLALTAYVTGRDGRIALAPLATCTAGTTTASFAFDFRTGPCRGLFSTGAETNQKVRLRVLVTGTSQVVCDALLDMVPGAEAGTTTTSTDSAAASLAEAQALVDAHDASATAHADLFAATASWPTEDGEALGDTNVFAVGQLIESVRVWCMKTGTQLKAYFKTYFDTLYATAAQGTKADTALQSDHASAAIGVHGLVKNNLAGTTAPGVGDDADDGYAIGSRWIDTVAAVEYVCMDPAAGAAVWESTTGAAGVGGSTGAVDNAVLRADGDGGAAMQGSDVIIDDYGRITRATINAPLEGYPNGTGGIRLALATGQGGARGALGSRAVDIGFPYDNGLSVGDGTFAAGSYSGANTNSGVVIGKGQVTATYAAAIGGENSTASGMWSFVGGGAGCTAAGTASRAGGHSAVADLEGSDVWGAVNSPWNVTTAGERMTVMMFGLTESLDTLVLLCHNSSRLVVPNNRTLLVEVAIIGRIHATGHTGMCIWRALFSRLGTTTRLVGSAVEVVAWSGDSELGAPSAVISADDANESVSIAVTPGAAAKTAWVAGVTAWRIAGS